MMPGAKPVPDDQDQDLEGTYEKAIDRSLTLLARRPFSRFELKERLLRAGFREDVANRSLARLADLGIIDDSEYSREVAIFARRQGASDLLIESRLRRAGVDKSAIELALSEGAQEDPEESRALALARRRARNFGHLRREQAWARLFGVLQRKGYDSELASTVCRSVLGDLPNEGSY